MRTPGGDDAGACSTDVQALLRWALVLKTIGLMVGVCALAFSATTTAPTTTTKKKTTKRTVHSASATPASTHPGTSTAVAKTSTTKSGSVASKSRAARSSKTRRVVRSYQQAPTADRYREIQQALISKGYLQGEPTGQWGPDSMEALRRFQTDQNLTADGKIGALSLIALGLGPKRLTAQSNSQAPRSLNPASSPNPPNPPNPTGPVNQSSPEATGNPASPVNPPAPPNPPNP